MPDPTVRSLLQLQASASTSRVLSLYSAWLRHAETSEYQEKPFFQSIPLNRSIIVKHRLREGEREASQDGRRSVTKIILPIDMTDLKMGAHTFFVGQRGYSALMAELASAGAGSESGDVKLLAMIDELPSLDPFLMREALKKVGFEPARCYFDLSDADIGKMFRFVQREVAPLVGVSFDDVSVLTNDKTEKLARRLLDDASDQLLDPLRLGLGMSKAEFEEGIFCWKGFIYYKWTLSDLLPRVRPVIDGIASVKAVGQLTDDERTYIEGARERLTRAIRQASVNVRTTLKVYDDAYSQMTLNGNPAAFREFLRNASELFYTLGDRLGAINHIVSFWSFRFPANAKHTVAADELIELLVDFELGIVETATA